MELVRDIVKEVILRGKNGDLSINLYYDYSYKKKEELLVKKPKKEEVIIIGGCFRVTVRNLDASNEDRADIIYQKCSLEIKCEDDFFVVDIDEDYKEIKIRGFKLKIERI
ncbi:MAG: hypothetical protein JHC31_06825 [Sulfurihydrogenibium sp.]|nr:hypothetical protein [Sulfurihydrogenibium sp.]